MPGASAGYTAGPDIRTEFQITHPVGVRLGGATGCTRAGADDGDDSPLQTRLLDLSGCRPWHPGPTLTEVPRRGRLLRPFDRRANPDSSEGRPGRRWVGLLLVGIGPILILLALGLAFTIYGEVSPDEVRHGPVRNPRR